ncbi:MAG: T9SS type A sorting domain-containing protein [Cyclobacteriaceae bacterium]
MKRYLLSALFLFSMFSVFAQDVSIDDVSIKEGNSGMNDLNFTVTISASDPDDDILVDYTTVDRSATAGTDYTMTSGTLTFSAGTSTLTQQIAVPVIGDTDDEGIEWFEVLIDLAAGNTSSATIVDGVGQGSIESDDLSPGDLAIVGYKGKSDPDQIAVVCLVDVPGGTELMFTDEGWNNGSFRDGEAQVDFVVPTGGWSAGTVFRLNDNESITVYDGVGGSTTLSNAFDTNPDNFGNLAGDGKDQVFIYQIDGTDFHFITGYHSNDEGGTSATDLDNTNVNNSEKSRLPDDGDSNIPAGRGLTASGSSATMVYFLEGSLDLHEFDDGRYQGPTTLADGLGLKEDWWEEINNVEDNPSNWQLENSDLSIPEREGITVYQRPQTADNTVQAIQNQVFTIQEEDIPFFDPDGDNMSKIIVTDAAVSNASNVAGLNGELAGGNGNLFLDLDFDGEFNLAGDDELIQDNEDVLRIFISVGFLKYFTTNATGTFEFDFTVHDGTFPATDDFASSGTNRITIGHNSAAQVTAITRQGANPTNGGVMNEVIWDVTFDTSVSGVSSDNFSLNVNGLTGTSITDVSGSGTAWTVTADIGAGEGDITLEFIDATGISPVVINTWTASDGAEAFDIDKTDPVVDPDLVFVTANADFSASTIEINFDDDNAIDQTTAENVNNYAFFSDGLITPTTPLGVMATTATLTLNTISLDVDLSGVTSDDNVRVVVSNVLDESGNTVSSSLNDAIFQLDKDQPEIVDVFPVDRPGEKLIYLNDTQLLLAIDDVGSSGLEPTSLAAASSYDVQIYDATDTPSGGSFNPNSVDIDGNQITLNFTDLSGVDDDWRIEVEPNGVVDLFGNVAHIAGGGPTDNTLSLDFDRDPPDVLQIVYISDNQLLVVFDQLSDNIKTELDETEALKISNYTVLSNGVPRIPISISIDQSTISQPIVTLNFGASNLSNANTGNNISVVVNNVPDRFGNDQGDFTGPYSGESNSASLTADRNAPAVDPALQKSDDNTLILTFVEPDGESGLNEQGPASWPESVLYLDAGNSGSDSNYDFEIETGVGTDTYSNYLNFGDIDGGAVSYNNTTKELTIDFVGTPFSSLTLTGDEGKRIRVVANNRIEDNFTNAIGANNNIALLLIDVTPPAFAASDEFTFIDDTHLLVSFLETGTGLDPDEIAVGDFTLQSANFDPDISGLTHGELISLDIDNVLDKFGNNSGMLTATDLEVDRISPGVVVHGVNRVDAVTLQVKMFDIGSGGINDETDTGSPNYSGSANNEANYTVTTDNATNLGNPVIAVYDAINNIATLTIDLSPIPQGEIIEVQVSGVLDLWGNDIADASTSGSAYSSLNYSSLTGTFDLVNPIDDGGIKTADVHLVDEDSILIITNIANGPFAAADAIDNNAGGASATVDERDVWTNVTQAAIALNDDIPPRIIDVSYVVTGGGIKRIEDITVTFTEDLAGASVDDFDFSIGAEQFGSGSYSDFFASIIGTTPSTNTVDVQFDGGGGGDNFRETNHQSGDLARIQVQEIDDLNSGSIPTGFNPSYDFFFELDFDAPEPIAINILSATSIEVEFDEPHSGMDQTTAENELLYTVDLVSEGESGATFSGASLSGSVVTLTGLSAGDFTAETGSITLNMLNILDNVGNNINDGTPVFVLTIDNTEPTVVDNLTKTDDVTLTFDITEADSGLNLETDDMSPDWTNSAFNPANYTVTLDFGNNGDSGEDEMRTVTGVNVTGSQPTYTITLSFDAGLSTDLSAAGNGDEIVVDVADVEDNFDLSINAGANQTTNLVLDLAPPEINQLLGFNSATEVEVTINEIGSGLDVASAQNTANYVGEIWGDPSGTPFLRQGSIDPFSAVHSGGVVTLTLMAETFGAAVEGDSLVIIVSGVLDLAGNNVDDATNNVASIIFDTQEPVFNLDLTYVGIDELTFTFTEDGTGLDLTTASDPTNYQINSPNVDPDAGGAAAVGDPFNPSSVTVDGNKITLNLVSPADLTDALEGDNIDLNMSGVEDVIGNVMTTPNNQSIILDLTEPQMDTDIIFIDENTLQVSFIEGSAMNSQLANDPSNYDVSNAPFVKPDAATLQPDGVTVILDVSPAVNSSNVPNGTVITINAAALADTFGNSVDAAADEATITFDGVPPVISDAIINVQPVDALSSNVLEVTFDEDIDGSVGSLASGFTIDGQAPTMAVLNGTTGITFTLTSPVSPGQNVTISYDGFGNIVDAFDNPLGVISNFSITNNLFGNASGLMANCFVDGINVSWTKPSGTFGTTFEGVILVGRRGSSVSFDESQLQTRLVNGDPISGDLTFGNGTIVVLNDDGNPATSEIEQGAEFIITNLASDNDGDFDITNLDAGFNYYFRAFAYRNSDDEASSGIDLGPVQPTRLNNLVATGGNNSITLTWDAPSADGCIDDMIIVARQGAPIESGVDAASLEASVASSAYSSNPIWSSRSDANDLLDISGVGNNNQNYIVYKGSTSNGIAVVTGLTNTIEYNFRAFLFDDTDDIVSEGLDAAATPFGAPTGFSAFAEDCAASNEINLTFGDPAGTFGQNWDGIVIYGTDAGGDISQSFTNLNNLRISSITYNGGLVDYQLDGSVDLSGLQSGDFLTVRGALNGINNGIFDVFVVDDFNDIIRVINPSRIDNTDDENAVSSLDITTITHISGNTIEYAFNSAPDFTTFVNVGDLLQVSGETFGSNDGTFTITSVAASSLRITNSGRTDGTDDQAGDSPGSATIFTAVGRTGEDAPTNDGNNVFGDGASADGGASVVAVINSAGVGNISISNVNTTDTYDFIAYAFKDNGSTGDDLFSSPLSVSGVSPLGISGLTATGGNERVVLEWTNGVGDDACVGQIVIIASERDNAGDNFVDVDVDRLEMNGLGISYTANTVFGDNATDLFDLSASFAGFQALLTDNDNYVVFNDDASDGLESSAVITGLTNDTEYHFAVFYIGDVANQTVSQRIPVSSTPSGPRSTLEATASSYTTISPLITTSPGKAVFEFTIDDDGAVDGDGLDMLVEGIQITENARQIANIINETNGSILADDQIINVTAGETAAVVSRSFNDLTLSNLSGTFSNGDVIQNGSVALVSGINSPSDLDIATVDGSFAIGQTIIGSSSNTRGDINTINDLGGGSFNITLINISGIGFTLADFVTNGAQATINGAPTAATTYTNRIGEWDNVISSATLTAGGAIDHEFASGLFSGGETILGLNSGATARVISDDGDIAIIESVSGQFLVGETIEGQSSTETADVSIFSLDFETGVVSSMPNTITFSGLDISSPVGFGYIEDNTARTYTLNLDIQPGVDLSAVGDEFNFEILTSNIALNSASSDFEEDASVASDEYGGNVLVDPNEIYTFNPILALQADPNDDQGVDLTVSLSENNVDVYFMMIEDPDPFNDGNPGVNDPDFPTQTDVQTTGDLNGVFTYDSGVGSVVVASALGLDPNTKYFAYVFVEDSDLNQSIVVSTNPVTITTDFDSGPPVVNAQITNDNTFPTSVALEAAMSEKGFVDYIVYLNDIDGDRLPTFADIVGGTDPDPDFSDDSQVVTFGSIEITDPEANIGSPAVFFEAAIGFLSPNTAYDIWIVGEDDESPANTSIPFEIEVITDPPASNGVGVDITVPSIPGLCTGQFFALDDIIIAERANTDFGIGAAQTLILTLPSGFAFDVPSTATASPISNRNIAGNTVAIDVQESFVTLTYSVADDNRLDQITISGLEVTATVVTDLTTVFLERLPTTDFGGTAVMNNNNPGSGRSHADFNSFDSPAQPSDIDLTLLNGFCQNDQLLTAGNLAKIGDVNTTNKTNFEWYTDAGLNTLLYDATIPVQKVTMTYTLLTNAFSVGDAITGNGPGTGNVVFDNGSVMVIEYTSGAFSVGNTISNTGTATGTINSVTPIYSTIDYTVDYSLFTGTDFQLNEVVTATSGYNTGQVVFADGNTIQVAFGSGIINSTDFISSKATINSVTSGGVSNITADLGINPTIDNSYQYFVIERDQTSLCPSTAATFDIQLNVQPQVVIVPESGFFNNAENFMCIGDEVDLTAIDATPGGVGDANYTWTQLDNTAIREYNTSSEVNETINPLLDDLPAISITPEVFEDMGGTIDLFQYSRRQYKITLVDDDTGCVSEVNEDNTIELTVRGQELVTFIEPTITNYRDDQSTPVSIQVTPHDSQNDSISSPFGDPSWTYIPVSPATEVFSGSAGLQTDGDLTDGFIQWVPAGLADSENIIYTVENQVTGCQTTGVRELFVSSGDVDAAQGIAAVYCDDYQIDHGILPALSDIQALIDQADLADDATVNQSFDVIVVGDGITDTGINMTVTYTDGGAGGPSTGDQVVIDFGQAISGAAMGNTANYEVTEQNGSSEDVVTGAVTGVTVGGTSVTLTVDFSSFTDGTNPDDLIYIIVNSVTNGAMDLYPDGLRFSFLFDETVFIPYRFNVYDFDPSLASSINARDAGNKSTVELIRQIVDGNAASQNVGTLETEVSPLPEVTINNLNEEYCVTDAAITFQTGSNDLNAAVAGDRQAVTGYQAYYLDGIDEMEVDEILFANSFGMAFILKSGDPTGATSVTGDSTTTAATISLMAIDPVNVNDHGLAQVSLDGFRIGEPITFNNGATGQITNFGGVITYSFNNQTNINASIFAGDTLRVRAAFEELNNGSFEVISATSTTISIYNPERFDDGAVPPPGPTLKVAGAPLNFLEDESPQNGLGIDKIVPGNNNIVTLTLDAAFPTDNTFQRGDGIVISGAANPVFNGSFVISALNAGAQTINIINLASTSDTPAEPAGSSATLTQLPRARAWAGNYLPIASAAGTGADADIDFGNLVTAVFGAVTNDVFNSSTTFRIVYTSETGADPLGEDCINTGHADFTIHPEPVAPVVDQTTTFNSQPLTFNFTDGGFEVYEFCEGDINATFALQIETPSVFVKYNWFEFTDGGNRSNPEAPGFTNDDGSFITSSANSFKVTANELFGSVSPGEGVYEFEITQVTDRQPLVNTPINAVDFLGCEGESMFVRIIVHEVANSPTFPQAVNPTRFNKTNDITEADIDQWYVFEYCEDDFSLLADNASRVTAFGSLTADISFLPLSNVSGTIMDTYTVLGDVTGATADIDVVNDFTNNVVLEVSNVVAGSGGLFAENEAITILDGGSPVVTATSELSFQWYPTKADALAGTNLLHRGPQASATELALDDSGQDFAPNDFNENGDTPYHFYVIRNEFNDNDGSDVGTFVGCTSTISRVDVIIHSEPVTLDDPSLVGDSFLVKEYYICDTDPLDPISIPRTTDVLYRWYNGDASAANFDSEIDPTDALGREITQGDLEAGVVTGTSTGTPPGGGNFSADISVETTYYYWVTQTTDDDSQTDLIGSGFEGCESNPVRISITVYPFEEPPGFTAYNDLPSNANRNQISTQTSTLTVDMTDIPVHTLSFCVGDISTEHAFEAASNYANMNGLRYVWKRSNPSAANQGEISLEGSTNAAMDASLVTAEDLGIVGIQENDPTIDFVRRHFIVTQETDFTTADGFEGGLPAGIEFDNFEGCESDPTLIEIIIYDIPAVPVIENFDVSGTRTNEIFLCEGESLADITVTGEGSSTFTWYSSPDDSDVEVFGPEVATGATVTGAAIGLGGSLTSGEHTFLVTQTADINDGTIPRFNGCESAALEVNITVFEDPREEPVNLVSDNIINGNQVCIPFNSDDNAINTRVPTLSATGLNTTDRVRFYSESTYNQAGFDPLDVETYVPLKEGTFGDRTFKPSYPTQIGVGDDAESGTTTFYVFLITNFVDEVYDGCSSEAIPVEVILLQTPDAPVTTGVDIVEFGDHDDNANTPEQLYKTGELYTFCTDGTVTETTFDIASPQTGSIYQWWTNNPSQFTLEPLITASTTGASILFSELEAQGVTSIDNASAVDIFVTETRDGCRSEPKLVRIQVGQLPEPTFDYDGLCAAQPFTFTAGPETLEDGTTITGIRFDFGDGTVIERTRSVNNLGDPTDDDPPFTSDDFRFEHTFTESSVFEVTLTITSELTCEKSFVRRVPVLPTVTVTSAQPYVQDFENPTVVKVNLVEGQEPQNLFIDGWMPDIRDLDIKGSDGLTILEREGGRDLRNTWEWGLPNVDQTQLTDGDSPDITADITDGKAWITNLEGYVVEKEQSFLLSPCFDLSGLERPMVRFRNIVAITSPQDGVALQYSTDNGVSWTVLGDYIAAEPGDDKGTGINWYSNENIQGDPGDQSIETAEGTKSGTQFGWGDAVAPEWRESRHKLDEIPLTERSSVIFRFALGANTNNFEGFGMDDFIIEERRRVVLVEQFGGLITSEAGPQIGEHNTEITNLMDDLSINNSDGVTITYQTDLEGQDPINLSNPADPNARVFFYGVENVPSSVLNGVTQISGGSASTRVLPWTENDFNKESLKDPTIGLNMALDASTAGDIVAVNVVLSDFPEVVTETTRLYLAVVERQVASGGIQLRNVIRKFLPTGSGSDLIDGNGDFITNHNHTWRIDRVNDPDNLEVIAFVQNSETREILQVGVVSAGDKDDNIVTALGDEFNEDMITVYPNPASDEVWVAFDRKLESDIEFTVYNQVGAQIRIGNARQGDINFRIDTSRLPSGMYLLYIRNDEDDFEHLKFVVKH